MTSMARPGAIGCLRGQHIGSAERELAARVTINRLTAGSSVRSMPPMSLSRIAANTSTGGVPPEPVR